MSYRQSQFAGFLTVVVPDHGDDDRPFEAYLYDDVAFEGVAKGCGWAVYIYGRPSILRAQYQSARLYSGLYASKTWASYEGAANFATDVTGRVPGKGE